MRTCTQCKLLFEPTGNSYRCLTCRREYDRNWRNARKAAGKSTGGGKMPREYHRTYEAVYFSKPENRERRNAKMRAYASQEKTRPHHIARWKVGRAIASGKLARQPCEVCGERKVQAHHDDYSKPLDVAWLCQKHHNQRHAKAEATT